MNLSVRVGLLAGAFAFVIALLISILVGFQSADFIKKSQGHALNELARQAARKLDYALRERESTIKVAASAKSIRDPKSSPEYKRKLIENFQSTYNEYNWLGLADINGRLTYSSNAALEGKSVANEIWFKRGMTGPYSGDNDPVAKPNDTTSRFIDISYPVYDYNNKIVGVFCGQLSWAWLHKLTDEFLDQIQIAPSFEMFVIQQDGDVLLSPPGKEVDAKAFVELLRNEKQQSPNHEIYMDHRSFLWGHAETLVHASSGPYRWTVVARQATEVALQPATQLRVRIVTLGACIGLFFGLIAAFFVNRFVRPFSKLGEAARRFKEGRNPEWPIFYSNDEAADLSLALKEMILSIEAQKGQLQKFNNSLQSKVEERTQALVVANQKLLSSESQIRSLMQTAPDAIIAINHSKRIISWNSGATAAFGYSEEETTGQMITFLLPDRFQKEYNEAMDRAANGEPNNYERIEIRGLRKDGSEFELELSLSCFRSHGMLFFTSIIRDITERKRTESALITARNEAEQAAAAKAQFLAQMSHEIRTPLNGMIGMSQMLLDTSLDVTQKDYTQTVLDCAEGLLGIINDVLDFSKVDAGKMDLEAVPFELASLVLDTEKALLLSATKKQIALKSEWMTAVPHTVIGDPGRVRQVLINLINNAIKFTSQGGVTVRLSHANTGDHQISLRVEVVDTGIGIPEEALDRMFKAFSQADSSMSRKYGGTGLGLSICKRIVQLMGGEIGVLSVAGKGSTFWFKIPLEISAKRIQVSPVVADPVASWPARILVAEDNPVNLQISLMMLKKAGYKPQGAGNGNEVLDQLRSTHFDLILMDCQMPELDGYEATKIIRSSESLNCKDIPVIAMTANVIKGAEQECLDAGMNDYVSKPVKLDVLVTVIEKQLRVSKHPSKRNDVA